MKIGIGFSITKDLGSNNNFLSQLEDQEIFLFYPIGNCSSSYPTRNQHNCIYEPSDLKWRGTAINQLDLDLFVSRDLMEAEYLRKECVKTLVLYLPRGL